MVKDKRLAKVQAAVQQEVDNIQHIVKAQGWTVLSAERSSRFPQYSYTVGLAEKGLPELIIVGLDPETSMSALNRLANQMMAGGVLSDGLRLKEIIPLFPVEVHALSTAVAAKHLRYAQLFAKQREWRAFQVFWPDPAGLFPWDEDFDRQWFQLQPVLEQLNAPPAIEQH